MIVLLASTSSMVSLKIFSFSLTGLKGDLGDRGEKCLRGEVIVTQVQCHECITGCHAALPWALITLD